MTARRQARAALLPPRPDAVRDDTEPFHRRMRVCPACDVVPADGMFVETSAGLVCLDCAASA